MALTGDFHTMPLADVLEWIGGARRSGLLSVRRGEGERFAVLKHGQIVAFGSNDLRRENVGHLLAARGLVAMSTLEEAIVRQRDTGLPLVDLLVAEGHVDDRGLARVLDETARELLYDVFLWDDGAFTFSAGVHPPLPVHDLAEPLDVREVLFDAVRLRDELGRIREVFPDERTLVWRKPGAQPPGDGTPFLGRRLFDAADSMRSVGSLSLETGSSVYAVLRELWDLFRAGAIQAAAEAQVEEAPGGPAAGAVDDLLRAARVLLEENQFEEAAMLFRAATNLDPEGMAAHEGLAAARGRQLDDLHRTLPPLAMPRKTPLAPESQGLTLSPRERFLLDRADGIHTVQALVALAPFGALETLLGLEKLRAAGLVLVD